MDDATVVRLIAHGASIAEVQHRVTSQDGELDREHVRAVLARASQLVQSQRLLPPTATGFVEHINDLRRKGPAAPSLEIDVSQVDGLRGAAERLLDEMQARGEVAERASDRTDAFLALTYAEALVKQENLLELMAGAGRRSWLFAACAIGSDAKILRDYVLYMAARGWRAEPDVWRQHWERMARRMEQPRDSWLYEEHENWLDSRDAIEQAIALVSPATRQALRAEIRPLDERFLAATREVSGPIDESSPWRLRAWWWYRVPRTFGDDFRQRLEAVAPAVAAELRNS
jgi:hypothetical protein